MNKDKIQIILEKEISRHKTPSVQYFFFNKERILKSYTYGLADIKNDKPANENLTYNAYSVTKTFTAIAVLQLAEQAKLDIEQPVKRYLPEFPYGDGISIRQVLSHSAGIPNAIPLKWIHLPDEDDSFDSRQYFNPIFNKNPKLKAKPGEKFAYTNLGYVMLGQLIEHVSGMPYKQYVTENIIKKLGLKEQELGFRITDIGMQARGYHKNLSISGMLLGLFIDKSKYMDKPKGKWKPFKPFYVNGPAYGGLIGSPVAFVRYIQELLKADCSFISENYKRMLFEENRISGNIPSGMCLSWFTGQLNGSRYFTHAGGGGGYYCEIRIYPEKELGSVIFFNRTGMTDERFLDKVDFV